MRLALAAIVVLVMGCAVAGIGIGRSQAEREPAPSQAAVRAAKQRIAGGGATVARGRKLFADEGCDRCHAIAAVAADGALGPRLDTLDEDPGDIAESIVQPRKEIVDGYPGKLMPTDFAARMSDDDIAALAAFVAAASGGEAAGGGDDGRGRRRGRGRGRGGD
ncbi:MAG: Cytochrome c [Solirubrobacteraceae bacterium]|jgi:mono/diheme cytochrome c family protein|nr:Cytochrome c [Solirubrobacteraceae bacterium]